MERHPSAPWGLAEDIAPGRRRLGVMLCSSPLHQLLLADLEVPLIATSANRGDEPMAIEREGVGSMADYVLDHDRPIARPVDDSLVAWISGGPRVIRRARGLAPEPLELPFELACPVLALGGHQKVAITLGFGSRAVTSQHLGDMSTLVNRGLLEQTIDDLSSLHGVRPELVAHDLHPDYFTTLWAERCGLPRVAVQHHHAHLAAALCEHGVEQEALGIIWDGTGCGLDGTVWGGEFLLGDRRGFRRVGWLRPFSLPGGELAAREPSRCAAGLLSELDGPRQPGLPWTTSAGRLFDGVASLLGFQGSCSYEGQAAAYLEEIAAAGEHGAYPMPLRGEVLDWAPTLQAVREQRDQPGLASARFHRSLVEGAVALASHVGCPRVVLSGGCFQNRLLLECLYRELGKKRFEVYVPSQFPCNDGGLSLGQLAVAAG
jgi:hydrogenase maturation protein HypF